MRFDRYEYSPEDVAGPALVGSASMPLSEFMIVDSQTAIELGSGYAWFDPEDLEDNSKLAIRAGGFTPAYNQWVPLKASELVEAAGWVYPESEAVMWEVYTEDGRFAGTVVRDADDWDHTLLSMLEATFPLEVNFLAETESGAVVRMVNAAHNWRERAVTPKLGYVMRSVVHADSSTPAVVGATMPVGSVLKLYSDDGVAFSASVPARTLDEARALVALRNQDLDVRAGEPHTSVDFYAASAKDLVAAISAWPLVEDHSWTTGENYDRPAEVEMYELLDVSGVVGATALVNRYHEYDLVLRQLAFDPDRAPLNISELSGWSPEHTKAVAPKPPLQGRTRRPGGDGPAPHR